MANVKTQQQINRVLKRLDKADSATRNAVRVAMYQEMVAIMSVSLRQVPVDTGLLRSTAYVTLPTTTSTISVSAGYGTNYGIFVHDNIQAHHNPPTKALYLSGPVEQAMPGFAERISKRVAKALKSGVTLALVPSVLPTVPKTGVSRKISVRKTKKRKRGA